LLPFHSTGLYLRTDRNNADRRPVLCTVNRHVRTMMLRRIVLTMGAVLALSTVVPQLALAKPQAPAPSLTLPDSCKPAFNPAQNVYLAPELANDPTYPEKLSGLEPKLKAAASKNGIQAIVVACQMEFDPKLSNPAVQLATDLAKKWENEPGFNKERFLITTYVRKAHSPTGMAISAIGGSWLVGQGFGSRTMSDRDNGPVGKNYKNFRNDIPGMMLNVVNNINDEFEHRAQVAKAEAERRAQAAKSDAEHAAHVHMMIVLALLGAIAAGLGAAFIVQNGRYRKAKAPAQKKLDSVSAPFKALGENVMKVKKAYMGFFAENSDWETKFKGATLAQLRAAGQEFDTLLIRNTKAQERLDQARAAFAKGGFFRFGGFEEALALLTTREILIKGKEKATKDLTLFGSLTNDETFVFDSIVAAMEKGFTAANSSANGIIEAIDNAGTDKDAVEAELKEIAALRDSAVAKGMPFRPYESRYAEIVSELQKLADNLASDPVGVVSQAATARQQADALKADVESAHLIKDSLAGIEETLSRAGSRAVDLRGQTFDAKYPGVTAPLAPAKYRLDEEDGNPDRFIALARQQSAKADSANNGGNLTEAKSALLEAQTAAAKSVAVVDEVLAAKALVEKNVAAVATDLVSIREEAPNFVAGLEAKLAQAKTAYFAQQFLAAQKLVESVSKTLEQREHTRSACDDVTVLVDKVYAKLQAPAIAGEQPAAYTTAAATIEQFNAIVEGAEELKKDACVEEADWAALSAKASDLLASVTAVSTAVDQQHADWRSAKSAYAALASALSEAYKFVQLGSTRAAASASYQKANQAYDVLSKQIVVANSDWAELTAQAKPATAEAQRAESLARDDSSECAAAERAMQEAETVINGCPTDFGYGVSADLSTATTTFGRAVKAFEGATRDYTEAARLARRAKEEAESAISDARDEAYDRSRPTIVVDRGPTIVVGSGPTVVVGGGPSVIVDDGPYVGGGGSYVPPAPEPDDDTNAGGAAGSDDDDDDGSNAGGFTDS